MTTFARRSFGLALGACAITARGLAQTAPRDDLSPGDAAGGLVGPLRVVTIITSDLAPLLHFYGDGLGLSSASVPAAPDALNRFWGMPAGLRWTAHVLTRTAAPTATMIRVLVTERPTPSIRRTWSRQELGPYGMGFPTVDVPGWDARMRDLAFVRATSEIERFPLKRPDGTPYEVMEATFNGPEFLRAIAISRRDGMAQVGDMDPATGRGGPAYATQIVTEGQMQAVLDFFTGVLDFEVRTDRMWRTYDVPFRFATVHAKGSNTGHVALAAYAEKDVQPGTGTVPAPPNRGMAIWSFPVKNLSAFAGRARNAAIVAGPMRADLPGLGKVQAMTVRLPSGFLIEAYQNE